LVAPVITWPTGFSPALSGTVWTEPPDDDCPLEPPLALALDELPPLLPHAATPRANNPVTAIVVTPRPTLIDAS
jgi:hypothetical protein